jgi:3-deoxy-D-manno-octulosonic acid kinase
VKTRSHKQDSQVIVYDAGRIEQPGAELFDASIWAERGSVDGEAEGRGNALFLDTSFGPAVLRKYLRGGQAARISRDRYLFTGYERSRPLAEFRMMEQLSDMGLPVPKPLAAMCQRDGAYYTGSLMTRRIMNVHALADLVGSKRFDGSLWRAIGSTIRRFHEEGVVHADLNARNILVAPDNLVYLIDFDRARIWQGDTRAFRANLMRLRRSLNKFWPEESADRLEECWSLLTEGYEEGARGT